MLAGTLLHAGLAINTRNTYHSGQKSFLDFCRTHGVATPLPADATVVCMWIAELAARSLKYTSIENYRWALHSLHTDLGIPSIINSDRTIHRMIKGVTRMQGAAALTLPRLPITPNVIRRLERQMDRTDASSRMLIAAIWVATSCMLRPGEIAVESATTRARMLRMSNLVRSDSGYTIHLVESKTDHYRAGVDVFLFAPSAIAALDSYLNQRLWAKTADQPLFCYENGVPLTHTSLVNLTSALVTKAGIPWIAPDGSKCKGVSFRKGGATALAEDGQSDRVIQKLGRWKSFCYQRYVHDSTFALASAFFKF